MTACDRATAKLLSCDAINLLWLMSFPRKEFLTALFLWGGSVFSQIREAQRPPLPVFAIPQMLSEAISVLKRHHKSVFLEGRRWKKNHRASWITKLNLQRAGVRAQVVDCSFAIHKSPGTVETGYDDACL